jgi:hypothetical protein
MTKRKAIPKSVRFEVFKRDSFTCQYCGRSAPDVVLQVDHIAPVSKGGDNTITNLITSCADCNAGKGDRELSDSTVVAKQQAQLAALQERREQIEMMMDWQRGLANLDGETRDAVAQFWSEMVPGYFLNDAGLADLSKHLKKYSAAEVMAAIRIAAENYLETVTDDGMSKITAQSANKAWDYVGRICNVTRREKDEPWLKDCYYIRGILRRRFNYVNDNQAIALLQEASRLGASAAWLKEVAIGARSWTAWHQEMDAVIEIVEGRQE